MENISFNVWICCHIENDKLLKEKFGQHLFLTFVNKEIFFQEYVEMELKIFFIIFEGFFDWQK